MVYFRKWHAASRVRAVPRIALLAAVIATLTAGLVAAQIDVHRDVPCCQLGSTIVVWMGERPMMSFEQLAAYCGPILWFSPDEPLIQNMDRPEDLTMPMAFPFEEQSDRPVVYYRIRNIYQQDDSVAFYLDPEDLNASEFSLDHVSAIDIDFFFYYPSEEGLSSHDHDVESVEMKIAVFRQPDCEECRYGITIARVKGLAHGIPWYDNTLLTDQHTRYPVTILVEEGKHASCTDKNGDGYYTPGYDVNRRVNDAWGVRDVMRTGGLFSASYQAWLAKVRSPEDRVFPPLPGDSYIIDHYTEEGVYAPGYQKYELRPFPTVEAARQHDDPHIVHFLEKGYYEWPYTKSNVSMSKLVRWFSDETFAESLSLAARFDEDWGISAIFPLFILRNYNEPITGGWLVNRIYFQGPKWRNFGYNVLFTPSASRWMDSYFSAGLEVDDVTDAENVKSRKTFFVAEAGIKLRTNVNGTPFKFLRFLTDFWGLRVGLRYQDLSPVENVGWVMEIGAGAF